MDTAAYPRGGTAEPNQILDLRGTGLGELARRAAVGEKGVTGVLSRTVWISAIPALKFNSSI